MATSADTLPARLLSARMRYAEELREILQEFADPEQRHRISGRVMQALFADLAEFAAREGESVCRRWEITWQEMAERGADDPQGRHEAAPVLRWCVRLIDTARGACKLCADAGFPVSCGADLDAVRAEVADRLAEAEMGWQPEPEWDPEQLARAKADIAAGNFIDIEDILRDLQG